MSESAALLASLSDRYRIEREIGAGGMATVYLARDVRHDRDVALKVLRPELAAVLGGDRFLNEVRITARLDHPHIVTLIDSGETGGHLWYVLPFIRGESLRNRLDREKQLGVDEALAITRQIAGALDYAHRQGVVHRDIKPENILLHEGEAMLADFGIALAVKEAGGNRLTETGLSLGTPQYMSPEQATGDRTLDARSDVYSLGAVLYEMLAGEPPVTGPTAQAMIAKLMTERPTRLRVVRDTVPEGIENAVAKALAKVPADRFASSADFARALEVRPAAAPSSSLLSRRLAVIGGAGLAVAVLAVLAALFWPRARATTVLPAAEQLTASGQAYAPILSPDGSQLAYLALCSGEPGCTNRLVVRELEADAELTVAEGTELFLFRWSPSGRWLVVYGRPGGRPPAPYLISRSGGQPIPLPMAESGDMLPGDTLVLFNTPAGASVPFMYRRVVPTLHLVDSVPWEAARDAEVTISADGRWMGMYRPAGRSNGGVLVLTDRSGRRTDSLSALLTNAAPRWSPAGDALLLLVEDPSAQNTTSLVRYPISSRGRFGAPDTLIRGSVGREIGSFDISAGGMLVHDAYTQGEPEVRTYAAAPGQPLQPIRLVRSGTLPLHAHVSADGRRLNFIVTMGERRVQFYRASWDSGAGRAVTPVITRYLDWIDTRDGSTIYVTTEVNGRAQLTRWDTESGQSTDLGELAGPLGAALHRAPGNGLSWAVAAGDTLHVLDRAGREVRALALPDSLGQFSSLNISPDDRELLLLFSEAESDSQATFVRVNPDDGRLRLVARLPAHSRYMSHNPDWTSDGWIHVIMRPADEPTWSMYRIRADGGAMERERPMPGQGTGFYVASLDGRRWVGAGDAGRSDLYLIRGALAPR